MTDTTELVKQIENDAMTDWSDERRKDFVGTFNKRTDVSRHLLNKTAEAIAESAIKRNFIGNKHYRKLNMQPNYAYYSKIGGRDVNELDELAKTKAKEILAGLPPLKKALSIIDPETSQMVIDKEKMELSGQKYLDQLDDISGDVNLSDLDQSMSIGELRAMVKKRDKRRRQLIDKLNEIGEELSELDKNIAKRLYAGIPGLSDAVVNAVVSCQDRAIAIGELSRRVEEKVMFGDSSAAMEILQSFEKDETEVSTEIKAEFKQAMNKLKLTGKSKQKTKKKLSKKSGK